MLTAWMVAAAAAGTPGYQACCAAASATACPIELSVSGPGGTLAAEGAATKLTGVWTLACEGGARFDPAASQLTAAPPPEGGVLSPIAQAAAACFDAACKLPAALCVVHEGDRARVIACDRSVASLALWQTAPVDDTRAAVVDKHVITVRDVAASTPRPVAAVAPPVAQAPSVASTPVDLTVPDAPPDPCRPTAQRLESQDQVGDGNSAALKGDFGYALQRYRAAITLNACNAFAWADMGEAFLALKDAGRARSALLVATRLMPSHYTAWANLGKTHEILGDLLAAASAYERALEAKPGFAPAADGLARVKPR